MLETTYIFRDKSRNIFSYSIPVSKITPTYIYMQWIDDTTILRMIFLWNCSYTNDDVYLQISCQITTTCQAWNINACMKDSRHATNYNEDKIDQMRKRVKRRLMGEGTVVFGGLLLPSWTRNLAQLVFMGCHFLLACKLNPRASNNWTIS